MPHMQTRARKEYTDKLRAISQQQELGLAIHHFRQHPLAWVWCGSSAAVTSGMTDMQLRSTKGEKNTKIGCLCLLNSRRLA